jgi:hypothetical protein
MDKTVIVPPTQTVSCIPPLLFRTDRCECPTPGDVIIGLYDGRAICSAPPPPTCSASISFQTDNPSAVQLTGDSGCGGLELALAVLLTKLLAR